MHGVHGRGGGGGGVDNDMLGAGGNSHIDLPHHVASQHVGAGSRLRVETSVRAPPDGGESRFSRRNTEDLREEWWQKV